MLFTNFNVISLPNVNEFAFEFKNIVVNNYGSFLFKFNTQLEGISVSFQNGSIRGDSQIPHLGVYNTGEPFSISGLFFQNPNTSTNSLLIKVGEITMQTDGYQRCPLANMIIATPSSGTLNVDVSLQSKTGILYELNFPDSFQIGSNLTGTITSNHAGFIFGSNNRFFNSFETLLSGDPFVAFLNPNEAQNFILQDYDTSFQNNQIDFLTSLHTSSGDVNVISSVSRTGLYDNTITQLVNSNVNNVITTLFGGTWTGGNRFVYSDTPQSLTMSYGIFHSDSLGQPLDETITYAFTATNPTNGQTFISEYVTGFQLTASGQYTVQPKVIFTGYYCVTGLQQEMRSMLFSSGCTGNLGVTFARNSIYGTGASGVLNLRQVTFQNIYGVGNNNFYVVDSFSILSGGTGYGVPPTAIVGTGVYSGCYDVVGRSGVNVAWFLPFNTSGGLNPSATYLTGEVLTTTGIVGTGIVSGGYTGYIVTGFNLTNPGSGYNATYKPFMRFVRNPADLIPSASGFSATGILSTKATGLYDFDSIWKVETGFAGYSLISGGFTGSINLPVNKNYLSLRVSCSGLDNTAPVFTSLTITTSAGVTVSQYITGLKTYNTDTGYLKKKLNVTGKFIQGSDLSFFLTQSDLDDFYSTAGYTNNSWTIDMGDLDF
jgi:hypothetical protein